MVDVVLIDARVQDATRHIAALRNRTSPSRAMAAHLIRPDEDGIAQIDRILKRYPRRIAVLHVISHGSDGALRIGSGVLDHRTLSVRSKTVAAWRKLLAKDADVLLYGCHVAATVHGQALVRQIGRLTRAHMAASSDATGNADSGGNWTLEFRTAPARPTPVLDAAVRSNWRGILSSAKSGGETRVNATTSGSQTTTTGRQVGIDASGNHVVVWQSGTSVMARVLNASGTNVVSEFTVGTGSSPQVAMNASGQFVVVWDASGGIKAQRFNASGTTSGSQLTVSSAGTAAVPSIAMNDAGNFVVAWSTHAYDNAYNYYRELHAAIYGWSSTIKSDFMVVNGLYNYTDYNLENILSSVAINSAGNIAIVADHGGVVFGSTMKHIWLWTFDAAGNLRTGRTRVNPEDINYRKDPSVAMDDSGNIAVVWTAFYGSYSDIYSAQALFSTGESVNPVVQAISDGNLSSSNASVTINKVTGVYTVAYQNANDIYLRQFASDGTSLMGQTLVNTTVAGAQTVPSVTRHGIYMAVVWTDPANSNDVMSQRYADAGPHHFELTTASASVAPGGTVNMAIKACADASSPCTPYRYGASGSLSVSGTNVTAANPAFTILSGATAISALSVTVNATGAASALLSISSSTPAATGTPKLWCGFGGTTPSSASSCSMPVNGLHHINVTASSATSLTCSNPVTFTLTACSDANCTTPYTSGVTGTFSLSGTPTTTLPAGNAFSITANSSSTTVQAYITTPGTVTASLPTVSPTPTASPATYCGLGAAAASNGSCVLSIASSGLLFSVPSHVSDVAQSVTVSAVRSSDSATVCTPAFANVTKAVNFTCAYNNPGSGTWPVRVGGTALNATASSSSMCDVGGRSVNLDFNGSGVATTTVSYADVGRVTLNATYTGSGNDSGLSMTGTSSFVTAPASFAFSAYPSSSTTAVAAGSAFSATVSARNQSGNVTPNFGREAIPESATLSWAKASPTGAGASAGSFSRSSGSLVLGSFSQGAATATDLKWSEVGTCDLAATLSSGSYLSSGLTVGGSTGSSGAVGRFIPHHFDTAVTQGCGAFTYDGQPFRVVVTAMNASNGITLNYNGTASTSPTYAKGITLSAASNGGLGSLTGTAIPASAFGAGQNSTAPSATVFTYAAKLTAATSVKIRATDADGVSSASGNEGTALLRSGRLRISDAYGSEKTPLDLPVQAQYWSGRAWVLNAQDSCTSIPSGAIALSNFRDHKGASAAWSTSPSSISISGGNGTLRLSAPSGIRTGTVDLAINLGSLTTDASCLENHPTSAGASQAWLRAQHGSTHACAADHVNSKRDPSARATFGIFSPESRKVMFVREIF